jgi:hypothetical protein
MEAITLTVALAALAVSLVALAAAMRGARRH